VWRAADDIDLFTSGWTSDHFYQESQAYGIELGTPRECGDRSKKPAPY
jgi:hypothetical protein